MEDKLPITETSTRLKTILTIQAVEVLEPTKAGMQLNEGYQFEVDGAFPEIADAIAKMAAAMDNDPEFGDKSGHLFITLINQYYESARGGDEGETTRV